MYKTNAVHSGVLAATWQLCGILEARLVFRFVFFVWNEQ